MAQLTAIAEAALMARQQLPTHFGVDAVCPSYDGLGLTNVAALVMQWLCPAALPSIAPPFNPALLDVPAVTEAWQRWQQAPIDHVILLILDAFGYDQMRSLMCQGDLPGLADACNRSQAFFMPATSVFPTTTVTALTSSTTAHAPAQHGVVCTHIFMPQVGSLVNLIGWRPTTAPTRTPYSDEQLNPTTLVPVPNLYCLLEQAGISVEIVNFHSYQQSSISRFTSAGSRAGQQGYISYLTPADGFAQLRDRRLARQSDKSFTYCYVPNIDITAHEYGALSACYRAEAAAIDFSLKRELLDPLAGLNNTVLLLVADHGQRVAQPDRILYLDQHPELTQHLMFPATGEKQCRFLHVKRDAEAEVIAYVHRQLDPDFLLISQSEAIALGLFGTPSQPVSSVCRDRIGDLILMPRADWCCVHAKRDEPPVGIHGGWSRSEMLIPFLAYRF